MSRGANDVCIAHNGELAAPAAATRAPERLEFLNWFTTSVSYLASSTFLVVSVLKPAYVNDTVWFYCGQHDRGFRSRPRKSSTGMPVKVSVDGSKSTHACLLVARRSSPAEEEVGTKFTRIWSHPVALANSGLPRAERGHQSKGTRGASRNRTDHAWPHRRQTRDAGTGRTAAASDRPPH